MRCGTQKCAWLVAVLCATMSLAAWAQEAPKPAETKPAKGPSKEQWAKLMELNQRINKAVTDAAQADAELKAMHQAQITKKQAAEEKRKAIIAETPELKALQDEIDEAGKKERELAKEILAKNPEFVEMEKQLNELRQKVETKRRELLAGAPEIAELRKGIAERQAKITAALKTNEDLKKLNGESDAAWNELVKKAAEKSPELAKLIEERAELMKALAPTPPLKKPEKKQEAK